MFFFLYRLLVVCFTIYTSTICTTFFFFNSNTCSNLHLATNRKLSPYAFSLFVIMIYITTYNKHKTGSTHRMRSMDYFECVLLLRLT